MIAKLVTHAPTREAAIDAQADALDAFVIDGIRHNIPFLSALMAHPRWRAGQLSTGFIAEEFPQGLPRAGAGGRARRRDRRGRGGDRSRARRAQAADLRPDERPRRGARQRPRGLARRRRASPRRQARGRGDRRALSPARRAARLVSSDWKPGEPLWSGSIDGDDVAVQVRPIPNGFALSFRGVETQGLRLHRARGRACAADAGEAGGRHRQAAAVPDAGPRRLHRRRRRARRSRPARPSRWSRR